MATVPGAVSLEEYMSTSYSPDCEYIDGVIRERNVGKGKHSYTQTEIASHLRMLARRISLIVLVEQQTRVSPSRIRIPDVCVVAEFEEITIKPPLLCVEVLSPDDRWTRVLASVSDYQSMGVPVVWVVDPYGKQAWIFDQEKGPTGGQDGMLKAENLDIAVAE